MCRMKICNWAFLVKGPRSSLECLPSDTPWWSLSLLTEHLEREAFIPGKQHEEDVEKQLDMAMQAIVRMNGIAVSSGHPGLIEMTHHVEYDAQNNRTLAIPLRVALKVTKLSGFGPTEPASIDFSRISAVKLSILGTLLDYWGQPNAESYEGLYKIYELIQSVAPDLPRAISNNKLSRLKQTCNNISSGPTARHADINADPVSKPLPLSEIRQNIGYLSELFIQSITLPPQQAGASTHDQAAEIAHTAP